MNPRVVVRDNRSAVSKTHRPKTTFTQITFLLHLEGQTANEDDRMGKMAGAGVQNKIARCNFMNQSDELSLDVIASSSHNR